MTTTVLAACPNCGVALPARYRGKSGLCKPCAQAQPRKAGGQWQQRNAISAQDAGLVQPKDRLPWNGARVAAKGQATALVPPCPAYENGKHYYALPGIIPKDGVLAACACGRQRRWERPEWGT